jgi:tetratricopeptide (TPR) repeat protein
MAAILALAIPASPVAEKDILCLKDGRVVQGPTMERKPDGIELTYPHGTILIPKAMIVDAVLAADANVAPATDEEKAMAAKGLVRYEGKWISPKNRDELLQKRLEKRHKELEQVEARKEWRNRGIQETAHFRFEYTVPDSILEDYRDTMEAYFQEFAKAWKIQPPKKEDRLPVCFHGSEETFHQVSGAGYGVLGYFRYVKPWDLNIYYERLDPALSTQVMFHESNHYLQQLIDLEFAVPHFPGESLAEYYGSSQWDPVKKKLTTGLVNEHRLSEIQEDISRGEMMDLDRMLKTSRMYQHYTWGWSLIHFLMNDARYQAKFQKFIFTLAKSKSVKREAMGVQNLKTVEGDEVERVFLSELGIKDANGLKKLETEWHDYVKGLKPATLRGVEESGISAAAHGRPLRALRILKEAIDKGSQNVFVYHRYAETLYAKGRSDEAIAMWKKAIELDPLNGEFYARIGYAMLHPRNEHEKEDAATATGKDEKPGEGEKAASAEGAPKDPKPAPPTGKNPEAERWIALGKDLGYDSPFLDIQLSKPDDEGGDD